MIDFVNKLINNTKLLEVQRTYIKQKAKKYAHELMHFIRVQSFSWFNKIIFRSKHVVLLSNVLYHREFILSMSCNKKSLRQLSYRKLFYIQFL